MPQQQLSGHEAVYDGISASAEVVQWCRRAHLVLISVCAVGTACQFLSLALTNFEIVSIILYFVYNCAEFLIVRLSYAAYHYENQRLLLMTARTGCAICIYDTVVALTVSRFTRTSITFMAVAGLVNVLIVSPAAIRELILLLHTRTNGVIKKILRPLNSHEFLFLVSFLFLDNIFLILACIFASLILLSGTHTGVFWYLLLAIYLALNVLPVFVAKVIHLIQTSDGTLAIKIMIVQFLLVLLAFILMLPTLTLIGPESKAMQAAFAIVGVLNGAVVAAAITLTSLSIYFRPRLLREKQQQSINAFSSALSPSEAFVDIEGTGLEDRSIEMEFSLPALV